MKTDHTSLIEWRSAIDIIDRNEIQLCPHCKGIGSIVHEELSSYHRNEYTYERKDCKFCLGDGRVVVSTTTMKVNTPNESRNIQPLVGFVGDPHINKKQTYGIKIDLRNKKLEQKYFELEQLSYKHYDKLVDQYYALDLLKEK